MNNETIDGFISINSEQAKDLCELALKVIYAERDVENAKTILEYCKQRNASIFVKIGFAKKITLEQAEHELKENHKSGYDLNFFILYPSCSYFNIEKSIKDILACINYNISKNNKENILINCKTMQSILSFI